LYSLINFATFLFFALSWLKDPGFYYKLESTDILVISFFLFKLKIF